MAAAGPTVDPINALSRRSQSRPSAGVLAGPSAGLSDSVGDGFRIDTDLEHAAREAQRVRNWLAALRQRHNLAPYEYTRHVQVVPASATYSHPILTLGTRFTDTEDHLLATYLHEQMHWYLSRLGGFDHDPIAPFFNELVRRYPRAPTRLPEGARNYEQTYAHIVVNWLEIEVTSQFIGWERARELANTQFGYRWIYRTVIADREPLRELLTAHGIWPMRPATEFLKPLVSPEKSTSKPKRKAASKKPAKPSAKAKTQAKVKTQATKKASVARRKTSVAKSAPRSPIARRKPRARGGRSAG
jgi:hypothetical protein